MYGQRGSGLLKRHFYMRTKARKEKLRRLRPIWVFWCVNEKIYRKKGKLRNDRTKKPLLALLGKFLPLIRFCRLASRMA